MYSQLTGSNTVNVFGIDPGSISLGYSVLSIDISTRALVGITAGTLVGTKMFNPDGWKSNVFGERSTRIQAMQVELMYLLQLTDPISVACESPFFNPRRPNAFEVLVEVLNMIKQSVYQTNNWRKLYPIDPPSVKRAVGAPGNADKIVMKEFVIKTLGSYYSGPGKIEDLDEHAIDAIAVGYTRVVGIQKDIYN